MHVQIWPFITTYLCVQCWWSRQRVHWIFAIYSYWLVLGTMAVITNASMGDTSCMMDHWHQSTEIQNRSSSSYLGQRDQLPYLDAFLILIMPDSLWSWAHWLLQVFVGWGIVVFKGVDEGWKAEHDREKLGDEWGSSNENWKFENCMLVSFFSFSSCTAILFFTASCTPCLTFRLFLPCHCRICPLPKGYCAFNLISRRYHSKLWGSDIFPLDNLRQSSQLATPLSRSIRICFHTTIPLESTNSPTYRVTTRWTGLSPAAGTRSKCPEKASKETSAAMEDFQDRGHALNMWGMWCEPYFLPESCRMEAQNLVATL